MINGLFLPLVGEDDAFFNLKYSLRLRYIFLVKLSLIILFQYYLIKKNKEDLFVKFCFIYVIFNFLFLVSSIFIITEKNIVTKKNINYFGKKNLIVLSFDGISGHKMNQAINSDRNLRELLKDFKFFKNVTSAWPATIHSINTELNERVIDINENNLKGNILNDDKIDTVVYANYKHFVLDQSKVIEEGKYKDYGNGHDTNLFFQSAFKASTGRWGTPIIIGYLDKFYFNKYYELLINIISLDFINKNKIFTSNINSSTFIQKEEFDLIFKDTVFKDNLDNVIRMYHFGFSHWPVKIDENCTEVKKLKIAMNKQEGIIIKCITKKIELFLSKLKKNNIYNNSLIIIKSDHAKPNGFYEEYPNNIKINNSNYWGVGRYKPFVMLKKVNTINKKIEISKKHIFLADLASTYCNFFYKENFCDKKYSYNNLLSLENSFKINKYDIYLPQTKYAFIDMNDFKKFEISNNKSLIENLKDLEIKLNK